MRPTPDAIPFQRVSIAPLAYLSEAWARVRDQYWLFLGITVVGVLLGGLAPLGLMVGPMMCGIYLCFRAQAQGRPVAFDLLFKGFDHFMEAFIGALLMMAASFVIIVPLVAVVIIAAVLGAAGLSLGAAGGHQGLEGGIAALGCLFYVGAIAFMMLASTLVSLLFTFTFPLIIDRRLAGLDAVKLSIRAAWANFMPLLGLGLTIFAMTFLGLCCCYVGALLVLPISFAAHWITYERVFGMAEDEAGMAPAEPGAGL